MPNVVKTFVNGGSLLPSDLNQMEEDAASAAEAYKNLLTRSARLDAPPNGGPYLLGDGLTGGGVSATNALAGTAVFRLDPAWEKETAPVNRTTYCNLRTSFLVNATAPAITFTAGLYKVETVKGGAAAVEVTLGSVIAGTTCALASPAKETLTEVDSGDFACPAASFYVVAVAVSGGAAANSSVAVRAILQMHEV